MKTKLIIIILLLFSITVLQAEVRAIWLPVWDFSSPEKIDAALENCKENNITHIIAQVRYRGDAMYTPNKTNDQFPNNEKRCYLLKDDFDPLQYLLDHKGKFKIFAWVTTFVVTPHQLKKIDLDHIYFNHSDWVTTDYTQQQMRHDSYEGAFLDPGIPEVQKYTRNVILDIATNYKLDGIQLDYIRYPDKNFGLNNAARKNYKETVLYEDADSWVKWKEDQISNFVKDLYQRLEIYAPSTILTAAVIANPSEAKERYSQDWFTWLEEGYIDFVFPMAYTTSDAALSGLYNIYPDDLHYKIIPGLRAWSKNKSYDATMINSKINMTRRFDFAGFSLYSYSGIIQNNYFKKLQIKN